jgi:ubiquinone biosynthesis protein
MDPPRWPQQAETDRIFCAAAMPRSRPLRSTLAHAVRVGVRVAQIAAAGGLAAAQTAWLWARLRDPARAAARAYVGFATRLGATFIKVGQIASTRRDLLPPSVADELAALQDRVPPFGFAEVRRSVEAELGRPIDAVFARFDPAPVAAASVAQVHRAVLRAGGQEVAVKVRRPDVGEKVALDRAVLLFFARALERVVPSLRLVALEGAVRSFCAAVEVQTHLSAEAEHNRRFARNFADDADVVFPRLHPEACADGVLTMDFVDGVREDALEAGGVSVQRVVEAGMRAVSRMIFLHGFVHADLHSGNLRFLAPGRVVFLDLGLVGELNDADRLSLARMLYALATGDGVTVARIFHDSAPHATTRDYARYEREVCEFVDGVRELGMDKVQITREIGRLFDILRRHKIQARSHMTMVNLALMTAEGLGKRLAPELSLTDEALPYLAEALGIAPPREASERG